MRQEITRISPRRFFWLPPLFLILVFSSSCEQAPADAFLKNKVRDCRVPVHYRAPGNMDHVAVVGDFNNWDPGAHPLQDDDGDHDYFGLLDLPPGAYHYAIWVDGYVFPDVVNPLSHFDDQQIEQSYLLVDDCSAAAWRVDSLHASAHGEVVGTFEFLSGASQAPLDFDSLAVRLNGELRFDADFEVEDGKLAVRFQGLKQSRYVFELQAQDQAGQLAQTWRTVLWVEEEAL